MLIVDPGYKIEIVDSHKIEVVDSHIKKSVYLADITF